MLNNLKEQVHTGNLVLKYYHNYLKSSEKYKFSTHYSQVDKVSHGVLIPWCITGLFLFLFSLKKTASTILKSK